MLPCAISVGYEHLGQGDVLALEVCPNSLSRLLYHRPSGHLRQCLSIPSPADTWLLTVVLTCILLRTGKAGSHFMLPDPVVSLCREEPVQDFRPLFCKVAHCVCACALCVPVVSTKMYSLLSEQRVVMSAVPQFHILHLSTFSYGSYSECCFKSRPAHGHEHIPWFPLEAL